MTDIISPQIELSISARLEALLFIAPNPVTISQLSIVLGITIRQVEEALAEIDALYSAPGNIRGLRIQRHQGHVQLTTAPQATMLIEKFLGLEATTRLSRAALETLAIVAYREPITRPQVDAIRGVNSDGVLKNLLSKGLILETGRADSPGRPILYTTTPEFLQHFGLTSMDELPPLDKPDVENEDKVDLSSVSPKT
jgi:segregation and condensation protein B